MLGKLFQRGHRLGKKIDDLLVGVEAIKCVAMMVVLLKDALQMD